MAKEDILLREEMGRLVIEPVKLKRSRSEENPFYNSLSHRKGGSIRKPFITFEPCSCKFHKKTTSNGISKRKNSKILKEPVLQILKTCVCTKVERDDCQQDLSTTNVNIDALSLCTLVKNCNQLKISNGVNENRGIKQEADKTKWWKNEMASGRENKEQRHSNQAGTCSQQALNPPCDVTIDELASYFETLVHIPKKMSSMAEMMYI